MNNYIDRNIDPIMKRTKSRPIEIGIFKQRLVLTISLSFIIVGEILLFIVALAAGMWGLVGIIAYIVLYSMWSKRKFVGNTIMESMIMLLVIKVFNELLSMMLWILLLFFYHSFWPS